jgi:FkbM family methyltransferase
MRKWPNIPEELSRHVDIKGTVLQAGGNCGFYARKYAEIFNKVITVEPDLVNFYCLLRNTRMHNHVHPYRAALGDKGDFISLELPHEKNVGTYFVSGQGNIPQITIDGMKLKWCNLIHLDIEGYELFALQGAKQTLQRCQPTVALEYNKLANKFGYDINDLDDFFEDQDYKKVAQYDNDIVYIPK